MQHKFIFIKKPSLFLLSAVVSVSLLNGCSNVREVLGKNKKYGQAIFSNYPIINSGSIAFRSAKKIIQFNRFGPRELFNTKNK